jgi:hypothetical protein
MSKPIKEMKDEEIIREIEELKWVENLAAQSSLQFPMGYHDNCSYNRWCSLREELRKRKQKKK